MMSSGMKCGEQVDPDSASWKTWQPLAGKSVNFELPLGLEHVPTCRQIR